MKKQNSFLKNSLLNFSSNIINIILGLVTTIIIARTLGAELQGIYTLIVLLPTMLVTFMNFGIAPATVFNIGKKERSLNTIISTNIVLSFFISISAIGVGVIFAILAQNTLFEGVGLKALLVVLLVLPFLFINSFLQAVYQGTENFRRYNEILVLNKVIESVFLVIVLIIFKLGLTGALIAYSIGAVLPTYLIYRYFKKDRFKFKIADFSWSLSKEYFRYGYKAHLSNIVSFLNYRMDILMVSFFLNPLAVGVYNIAVSIAERLWIFSTPVSAALFPRISSLESDEERSKLTVTVTRYVLYLSIIVGIVFYVISPLAIKILFGNEYSDASNVIKLLLVGITVFAAERILSNDLAGRGKPELNLYTSIFTVLCNLTLNIILIPLYGINGAAISTSIAYILTFIVKMILFKKVTDARVMDIFIFKRTDWVLIQKMFQLLKKRLKKK